MATTDIPAGRQLDAEVARKLGWTHERGERLSVYWHDHTGVQADLPQFSAEIIDAWRIVERFLGNEYDIVIAHDGQNNRWDCNIISDDMDATIFAYAETAPLAICRMVLAQRAQGDEA